MKGSPDSEDPDLKWASWEHTKEHPFIRCLAPEKLEEVPSSPDQRLTLLEKQLDGLCSKIENIEQIVQGLATSLGGRGDTRQVKVE